MILILPQLDSKNLRQTFVTDSYGNIIKPDRGCATNATGPGGIVQNNATARGTVLPFMLCPSDPFNRSPFVGSSILARK